MVSAVAVGEASDDPFVVLDEDYLIVEVEASAEAGFGPLLGRCVWDCFPGSEPMYRPYYERARRSGQPVELAQYYGGYLTRVRAVPREGRTTVYWQTLCMLDTRSLDSLRSSLTEAMAALDEWEAQLERERVRGSLRVIEGRA